MEIGTTYTSNSLGTGIITAISGNKVTVKFNDGFERVVVMQTKSQEAKNARKFAEKKASEEINTFTKLIDGLGGFYNNNVFSDEARNIVTIVAAKCTGFAKDVANTVIKSGRLSEKQAAIIAMAFDSISR